MSGSNTTRLLYDNLICAGAPAASPLTLGALLTSGGTTITLPGALQEYGVNIPTLVANQYIPLTLSPVGDPSSATQAERVWLTAYTAGATTGTIARGKEGSTAVAHNNGEPFCLSAAASDMATGPNGGGLIGFQSYRPAADAATYTVTGSAPGADIDATNLAVTFTAPPSGAVLVQLKCWAHQGSGVNAFFTLREGSTTLGTTLASSSATGVLLVAAFEVTGLTPGSSHTYKWGGYQDGAGSIVMAGGPTFGSFVMEVWAVNL